MKLALAIVALVACSKSTTPPAAGSAAPAGCPLPMPKAAQARFAVGVEPLGDPACHGAFVRDDKVLAQTGKLIAEGSFRQYCDDRGEAGPAAEYIAVAPAKIAFVSRADGGPKPIAKLQLAMSSGITPIAAGPLDRCGDPLRLGNSPDMAHWSHGDCDHVLQFTTARNKDELAVIPSATGACTLSVELLGIKADLPVVVQ